MRDVKDPEVRRAEIMEAALHLFVKKGYLKTTTQDIITKANISRGLLYYHFKDKEDILYCLVERYSEPMIERLFKITYDDKSAIEKIRSFIEATLIQPNSATPDMIALQNSVDLNQNRYLMDRFAHKVSEKLTTYLGHIMEQGISEGVFHVARPLETASFLINGYVFVSIDTSTLSNEKKLLYYEAYKSLLERALGTTTTIF
ncbi:TetR/AcrR family transcriptional regulator [Siminovitchia sp. FSL H7-0308]|uniref:TetR/AcrR family transcriptional regulator n=1 Tax=Siminovitchia sp. FSL H7-0308 TaxID=2921432 RepID=UPI0030EB2E12